MQITVELVVFLVLSLIALAGGLGVVLARNLFRAALWLLLSLFGVAGLLVLLSAPFLAAVQVLIYMGGITILIIFAVMLTRGMVQERRVWIEQWDYAVIVALAFFALILYVIYDTAVSGGMVLAAGALPPVDGDTTQRLGVALVDPGQYVLPFEVASLLLAGALIGAIYIARDDIALDDAPTDGVSDDASSDGAE